MRRSLENIAEAVDQIDEDSQGLLALWERIGKYARAPLSVSTAQAALAELEGKYDGTNSPSSRRRVSSAQRRSKSWQIWSQFFEANHQWSKN